MPLLPISNLSLQKDDAAPNPRTWSLASSQPEPRHAPEGCFIACYDRIMTTVQLRVMCFTDRQGLRALSIALGYKSRAILPYMDHPLDYLLVMLFTTGSKCSLVS